MTIARTQKRKGIGVLPSLLSATSMSGYTLKPIRVLEEAHGIQTSQDVLSVPSFSFPFFARPCPTQPRHGFVESRMVYSQQDVHTVLEETLAADPHGEVMLMPFIPSIANAVYTPTGVSLGAGHDGATGGRVVCTFPLVRTDAYAHLKNFAGMNEEDDPYVEVVIDDKKRGHFTQFRGGPHIEGMGRDYLPDMRTVSTILTVDTSMSLLTWEELILSVQKDPGVVVYHPTGSLVDHFAVHARSAGIPVLISRQPQMGEMLHPTAPPPMDPTAVLRGIAAADAYQSTEEDITIVLAAMNLYMLVALHHSVAFSGDDGWWLGLGAGFLMRLGSMALRGEARHLVKPGKIMEDRLSNYQRAFSYSLHKHRATLPIHTHILRYGAFSGSIGGKKWAQCGMALAEVYSAVGALARHPNQETVGALLRAYNVAINQAHNGGWWLNKFGPDSWFDAVQTDPKSIFLLLPWLWEFYTTLHATPMSEQYRKWRRIVIRPASIKSVSIDPVQLLNNVSLYVMDRVVGARGKHISIPINGMIQDQLNTILSKLVVVNTKDGRQVKHGETIIWQEPPISIENGYKKKETNV